ncbi:DUF317 domain-containing protein [Streptomyces gulbargensis]|uniref:DUF317 domain-containing protein n=1 Tax=Streptomyces gulbargensis TaxID=364901 RepID=A0ABP7LNQ0_9ACTN
MAVSRAQRASYADDHRSKIPFHTSPRHLAGPGDPRHVTHALLAAGWRIASAPGDPRTVLTGPDHDRHQLVLDPFAGSCWRIQPADWSWYASFDRMVPAEIIAGFTDRLIDTPRQADTDPWQLMEKAGWTVEQRPDGTREAVSPDLHPLRAELVPIGKAGLEQPAWHIEAQPQYGGARLWHIWISGAVPDHLITGLVEQLVSTAPVVRGMHDTESHGARQEPSGLSPEQVLEAHFARLEALTRAERRTRLAASLPRPLPNAAPRSVSPR